jgi:benzoate-CoA ligase family protein
MRGGVKRDTDQSGIARLVFPETFNAAEAYIDRHLAEGRSAKLALRTLSQDVTYAGLAENVNRYGNALLGLGIKPGERVLMVVKDCPEFPYVFWGAIKAGIVPVPLNTLWRSGDYQYVIENSQCAGLVYSPEYAAEVEPALATAQHKPARAMKLDGAKGGLQDAAAQSGKDLKAVASKPEDDCFWLYSSGTTGRSKGVVHAHKDLVATTELYAAEVMGAEENDIFYSVPKLFFAYGLGSGMTFSFWVGATTVLDDRRPTPQTVAEVFKRFKPTAFSAVPTFLAAYLASDVKNADDLKSLKRVISGGEALPPDLQRRWLEVAPVPIMDGIGSTEILHIYISNRSDDIRPGSSGKPVPGYQARILDENHKDVAAGTPGKLWIKGPSVVKYYWNRPELTAEAIVDGWFNTGDTYQQDEQGYYYYCGRNDDMLKVGGIWVSPFEIESALISHPKVLEAAVVAHSDENGLVKPEAWIVLRNPSDACQDLEEDIRSFCKSNLAPYKYPRWIHFVQELPKTATGKIQRFKLRHES